MGRVSSTELGRKAHLVVLGPIGPVDELHEHARHLPLASGRCRRVQNGDDLLDGIFLQGCDGHCRMHYSSGHGETESVGNGKRHDSTLVPR